MTSIYDTDPNPHTFAWGSSPLGEPDRDARDGTWPTGFVTTADDARPFARRAVLAAALACGVIGGATLGAVLFGGAPSAPRAVVLAGPVGNPVPPPAVVAPNVPAPTTTAPAPRTVTSQPRTAPHSGAQQDPSVPWP